MPVIIKNKQWDVDGDGVACIITPGIPAQVITLVPSTRLDREIARQTAENENLISRRDELQAELDTKTAIVTDLTALRATVTAEPPE